jgi:hypothetical protein
MFRLILLLSLFVLVNSSFSAQPNVIFSSLTIYDSVIWAATAARFMKRRIWTVSPRKERFSPMATQPARCARRLARRCWKGSDEGKAVTRLGADLVGRPESGEIWSQ